MNILIPHSWLLEQLKTKAKPEEIRDKLSLAGPSVETIEKIEGEPVYDIEITTNRVDAMSVRGIAREAAVILEQFGLSSELKDLDLLTKDALQLIKVPLKLPKITNDPKLCSRITCIILKDVQNTPTPDWMAKRLKQVGQKIHHAAVDITNYVTHEIGHPIHAFDYDQIMKLGGEIIVKKAEAGQSFTTLDGESYEAVGGEVVFVNQKGEIIDLPAVKGTANTSINQSTKNILLWIEKIKPSKVRHASIAHAIRTTAAQLNEKDVDPHLAEPALLRAIELYQDLCQAQPASQIYDDFPGKEILPVVELALNKIDQYLGLNLKKEKIMTILEDLGCQVKLTGQERLAQLTVQPPTFRSDLKIPADIIEEVARIYGYHQLPSKLMATPIPLTKPEATDFKVEERIKHFLANLGWQEIYSYSLVSEDLAQDSGWPVKSHLKLENPLTDDKVYLRRSLLPSLVEVIEQNSQKADLAVYELANVYHPQGKAKLPQEKMKLGLVAQKSYRQVRGQVEALLNQFYVEKVTIEPFSKTPAGWVQAAKIKAKNKKLGTIGLLKNDLIGVEVELDTLLSVVQKHPTYQPIPKTMPVTEDMTFTLKPQTAVGPIMAGIKKLDQLIVAVELKTIYQRNHTFTITYHHPEKNLSMNEIEPIRQQIAKQLAKSYQAKLVGEV